MGRHGAAAQVVAVAEAAGQHHEVDRLEVGVLVPDHDRLAAGRLAQRHLDVAVAVGAGEDDDRRFHVAKSPATECPYQIRRKLSG